jgi:hypothetical protein
MKKIVLTLLFILPLLAKAQFTTANPDTVCIGSTVATYQVDDILDYVYTWSAAAPGVITSGQDSNTITIDWSASPAGLIPNGVSVFATNEFGCIGDPVFLDVFILEIIRIIDGLVFCEGDPCVDLIGTPEGGQWSGTNVVGSQYCPDIAGTFPITYTVEEAGCVFSTTTFNIITNPTPILLEIEHD